MWVYNWIYHKVLKPIIGREKLSTLGQKKQSQTDFFDSQMSYNEIHFRKLQLFRGSNKVRSTRFKQDIGSTKLEIDNQIQQLLKNDLIEPSYSLYAAPVTLAFKKYEGRRSRLCVDYRLLNKMVIPECYPFPRVVDVIEKTIDCEYFSTVDINSAFWAIEVSPKEPEPERSLVSNNVKDWQSIIVWTSKWSSIENDPKTISSI